jgi:hypothetical protein
MCGKSSFMLVLQFLTSAGHLSLLLSLPLAVAMGQPEQK